ncbi:MAG TPA: aldehyde dehydrogenase family protein [Chloroflexia bacterium]|nr:aldehyde dehydrogenase family protein [Chloroflexia bacterium]
MDKAVASPGTTPGDPEVHRAEYAEKAHGGNEQPSFARDLVKNYIGGKWVEGSAGRTFDSRNPATGELLGVLTVSSPEDVNMAVEAAEKAFKSWRLVPAPRRGEILFKAAQALMDRKEDLARLMTQEMGKVLNEARGDVQEAIDMTFYMAGEGRRLLGEVTPSELPNKFAMAVRDPIGVVGAITRWNFPIAIPSWKLMPAVIAGNTVVFKPASDTPLLAIELVKILEEAGLPQGVVNVVLGPGGSVGEAIIDHPGVKLISFTGSTAAGQQVSVRAAQTLKRVSLEMGGKNAIIVMNDADLDLATEGILWSAFGTTGQRCTAASRVIVHRDALSDLQDRLVARIERFRLGNGLEEGTDIGPVVNRSQLERIHKLVSEGREGGSEMLTGGEIATDGDLSKGNFYKPTLFTNVKWDDMVAQEEIFGPVTALIPVDSLEEAIEVNNNTKYGLSSSIYTRDVNNAFRAMRDITTGIIYVNAGTIGAEIQLPFGGTRGTGNGHREAGQAGLDVFTEWKTLYIDFSGKLQRAQIDLEDI